MSTAISNLITAVLTALVVWFLARPKQKAEVKQSESATEKIQAEVTEKYLLFFKSYSDDLSKELEKWKAELAVQAAIYAERERKWAAEKVELIEQVRLCVEREDKNSAKQRAILQAQDTLSLKFELQTSATDALREEFRLLRAAVDAMLANGTPSNPPIPEGSEV